MPCQSIVRGGVSAGRWVLLCALAAAVGCAGSGLNPSFLALFGVDPVSVTSPITGHVAVLFINESNALGRMETNVTTAAGATQQLVFEVRADSFGNKVAQCDIQSVTLTRMAVWVDHTIEVWGYDQTEVGGTTVLVPMLREQYAPRFWDLNIDLIPPVQNVRCGSVVAVTLRGQLYIPSLGDIDGDGVTEYGWLEDVGPPDEFPFVTVDGEVPGTTPERQVIIITVR